MILAWPSLQLPCSVIFAWGGGLALLVWLLLHLTALLCYSGGNCFDDWCGYFCPRGGRSFDARFTQARLNDAVVSSHVTKIIYSSGLVAQAGGAPGQGAWGAARRPL